MRTRTLQSLVITIAGLGFASGAASQTLLGVGGNGSNSPGTLFSVDDTTGENTAIADPVTPGGLSGIALDPLDPAGTLYGSTIAGTGTTSDLVEIDPDTGALLSTIGPITVAGGGPAISIGDLAFEPDTGVLFGLRSNADGQASAGEIYTIDLSTAEATLVGASVPTTGGGIAFDPDGTFYRSGGGGGNPLVIEILDPSDASVLQTFSGFLVTFFDGLTVSPDDGLLFATGGGGVHTIDLVGQQQTTLTPGPQNGDSMSDLVFVVPEPGALAMLTPGMALLAVLTRRRRLRAAAAGRIGSA